VTHREEQAAALLLMADKDIKEEIKRRIDIVELISQYVPLKKAGRRFKARCPFHEEKTASFFVDPVAGLWHCFGCGAGGDVFSFLEQIEGISFPEAGERLAERCGLTWRAGRGEQAQVQRSKLLRRAVKLAAEHFSANLHKPSGQSALDYLRERGFSDDIVQDFGLGFAVDSWDELLKFLSGKGISVEHMREAGLVKRGERGSDYDVFRNRIIFPIVDAAGAVIGFGGRAMDPDEPAKYLNSPDTPLFNKRQNLYGLAQARQELVAQKRAIVVEGYTDVIALHQAGIRHVVATLGTSMTQEHLRLLRRYVDEVILCFDADAAGMAAALRNIELFEGSNLEARVMVLPEGTDPDEFVGTEGADRFQELAQQAVDLVEYRLEMLFHQHRDQGAGALARAAREAVDVLRRVPDRTRRDEFLVRAADRWGRGQPQRAASMQAALRMELQRRAGRQKSSSGRRSGRWDRSFITETIAAQAEQGDRALAGLERELLVAALESSEWAEQIFSAVRPEDFQVAEHHAIAQAIATCLESEQEYKPQKIPHQFSEQEGTYQLAGELLLAEPSDDLDGELLEAGARKLRKHRLVSGLREEYELQAEDEAGVSEEEKVEDFQKLQQRISQLAESGELTHDHPDYQKYVRLVASFHGKGQFEFLDHPGAIGVDTDRQIPGGVREQSSDEEGKDEGS